jgi:hypothetical protein
MLRRECHCERWLVSLSNQTRETFRSVTKKRCHFEQSEKSHIVSTKVLFSTKKARKLTKCDVSDRRSQVSQMLAHQLTCVQHDAFLKT